MLITHHHHRIRIICSSLIITGSELYQNSSATGGNKGTKWDGMKKHTEAQKYLDTAAFYNGARSDVSSGYCWPLQ